MTKVILILTILLAFILFWRAETIYLFTQQSKTMFQFCGNERNVLGKNYVIYCGDDAVKSYFEPNP